MKVFIASSTISLLYASKIRAELRKIAKLNQYDLDISLWNDTGIFVNGTTTIEELIKASRSYDYAIFLFYDDDLIIRGKNYHFVNKINSEGVLSNIEKSLGIQNITRDNVIFEYGLFASYLGTKKCFVVAPSNVNLQILTDIGGLTTIRYTRSSDEEHGMGITDTQIRDVSEEIFDNIKSHSQNKNIVSENRFFSDFMNQEEPEIRQGNPIEYSRSFNLLLHMFQKQNFSEFRAFDLAIHRWEELMDSVDTQVQNISRQILSSQASLHREKRCKLFRRILVVSGNSLSPKIIKILRHVLEFEDKNINKGSECISETRIFCIEDEGFVSLIKRMNDFAMFSDGLHDFAIVEKSLVSPIQHINKEGGKVCVIECNNQNLEFRRSRFDDIWSNYALPINKFIDKYYFKDLSRTIDDIFNHLLVESDLQFAAMSIAIETSYVEMRKINNLNRLKTDFRALEFLTRLLENESYNSVKSNIFLNAFINDFRPVDGNEQFVKCYGDCVENDIDIVIDFKEKRRRVVEELKIKNLSYDVPEENVKSFLLTKTRNESSKRIKQALIDESTKDKFSVDINSVNSKVEYRNLKGDLVYLGYLRDEQFIPNCTLLMAQHYFDLFSYVYQKDPTKTDFWIFDFVLASEKDEVSSGASLAFDLFTWPKDLKVHIVNCWYSDHGNGEGGVKAHHGPIYRKS
ncbi:TIR domain-containing protein [Dyadobacter sandarakinus]|uniref:Nucleotide-binding protein n=1 Tax=Dyadobacter sandarakinus TaxID=2747268 RepID=A0ABX7I8P2_9BACT|nr:TIR domain-containing protein [Dyadobacter sandarakinus]QRR02469.1 nucleotide-binding protein [Dyadobacter sandarakinus]